MSASLLRFALRPWSWRYVVRVNTHGCNKQWVGRTLQRRWRSALFIVSSACLSGTVGIVVEGGDDWRAGRTMMVDVKQAGSNGSRTSNGKHRDSRTCTLDTVIGASLSAPYLGNCSIDADGERQQSILDGDPPCPCKNKFTYTQHASSYMSCALVTTCIQQTEAENESASSQSHFEDRTYQTRLSIVSFIINATLFPVHRVICFDIPQFSERILYLASCELTHTHGTSDRNLNLSFTDTKFVC